MNTRHLGIVLVVVVIAVVLVTVSVNAWMRSLTIDPGFDGVTWCVCEVSSLGEEDMNVTQGSTLQVNFNLTSITDQELTIPAENVRLIHVFSESYDGELDTFILGRVNYYLYNSSGQDKVFDYAFGADQVVLQPGESGSIVLTLEVAENAPLGEHSLYISLGDYVMGLYQRISYGGFGFKVTVTSQLN